MLFPFPLVPPTPLITRYTDGELSLNICQTAEIIKRIDNPTNCATQWDTSCHLNSSPRKTWNFFGAPTLRRRRNVICSQREIQKRQQRFYLEDNAVLLLRVPSKPQQQALKKWQSPSPPVNSPRFNLQPRASFKKIDLWMAGAQSFVRIVFSPCFIHVLCAVEDLFRFYVSNLETVLGMIWTVLFSLILLVPRSQSHFNSRFVQLADRCHNALCWGSDISKKAGAFGIIII